MRLHEVVIKSKLSGTLSGNRPRSSFSNEIYSQCDSRYRLPQASWTMMATAGRLNDQFMEQRGHATLYSGRIYGQVLGAQEFAGVTSGLEPSNCNGSKNLAKIVFRFFVGLQPGNLLAIIRDRHNLGGRCGQW